MGYSIFITGTDTGVGKTFCTTGLIRSLRDKGVDAVGCKPIESGGRDDAQKIRTACDDLYDLDEINPLWFEQPLAPLAAADSPESIDIDLIRKAHHKLVQKHELVLVEGAGGWLVPITVDYSMADLAAELCDEVIIVAANRLGVINHTLLTFRAIEEKDIDCSRLILNHLPQSAHLDIDPSISSNAELIRKCLPRLEVHSLLEDACFRDLAGKLSR